ncbi:MAG: cold shock and DUF1294 domain-containing protein [Burkholderiaceae bacterium]|jgi:uncharacterized membrane protein YsdA (DUF1294 family)/cold shock CspA family protein|nr:cold shock and DUF1294 domain-containing protein [Burkholderiaceae bacterium]
MRHQGRLTEWNDTQGYGFITPNGGGARVFVHRTEVDGRRPRGGELLTYELEVDARKRHSARRLKFVQQPARGAPAFGALVTTLLAAVFFAFIVSAAARGALPWALVGWYGALSVIAFFEYRHDKAASRRRAWRTQESTLHLMALAGGWPGALLAQRWLRHKSAKTSFQSVFVATVAINLAALVWLARGGLGALHNLIAR